VIELRLPITSSIISETEYRQRPELIRTLKLFFPEVLPLGFDEDRAMTRRG